MRVVLALILCGLLAACASGPREINPTATSVSYQYSGDQLPLVTDKATAYCNKLGRAAKLKTVSHTNNDQSVAIFACER